MMKTIGGLPLDVSLQSGHLILGYILLLLLVNGTSGIAASKQQELLGNFVLVRCGWRKWTQRFLLRSELWTWGTCIVLLPIGYLTGKPTYYFPSWSLFTLYATTCAGLQCLCMGATGKGTVAFSTLTFLQLCSIFVSKALPGQWKLLLLGNWGCYMRTIPIEEHGVSLVAVIVLNFLTLCLIHSVGWRLIRYIHRKE